MLYSTVKPVIAATAGKIKGVAQVFAGAVITGAGGNTMAVVVLSWQAVMELMVPAGLVPQRIADLYLALIVQQPGVLANSPFVAAKVPKALKLPPGACTAYSAVNPETGVTAVIFASLVLQVLAGAVIAGAAGKMITLTEALAPQDPVLKVLAAVLPQAEASI